MNYTYTDELYHYGILGQKWGIRRYQNEDGTYTAAGKERRGYKTRLEKDQESIDKYYSVWRSRPSNKAQDTKITQRMAKNYVAQRSKELREKYPELTQKESHALSEEELASIKKVAMVAGVSTLAAAGAYAAIVYGRDYMDQTIKAGTTIQTLTHDKNRFNKGRSFFTSFRDVDKNIYEGMFGGKGGSLKYAITATANKDIKIASAKSGEKVFKELLKTNPEFAESYAKVRNGLPMHAKVWYKDGYHLFNAAMLPLDNSTANGKLAGSMIETFYNELKTKGYGGLIDVNDTRYSNLRAVSPAIMFDRNGLDNVSVRKLTYEEIAKGRRVANVAAPALHKVTDDDKTIALNAINSSVVAATIIMKSINDATDTKAARIADREKTSNKKNKKVQKGETE